MLSVGDKSGYLATPFSSPASLAPPSGSVSPFPDAASLPPPGPWPQPLPSENSASFNMQTDKYPTNIARDPPPVGEAIHRSYCLRSHKECFPCSFRQFQYLQLDKTNFQHVQQ